MRDEPLETAGQRIRVGIFIDGSEGYGLLSLMESSLRFGDRSRATYVGLFLGRGEAWDRLAPLCDETVDLGTGALLPLSNPRRSKYNLTNMLAKGVLFVRATVRAARAIRLSRLHVVHVHAYPVHLIAGLACRMAGAPCVWHWHGSIRLTGAIRAITSRLGLAFLADRIVCISRFVMGTLPESLHEKCVVVYNGVNAREIGEGQRRGELRRRLGLDDRTPLIGIFGSLTPYKGHELFLRAAAFVLKEKPNARFGIFGDANEILRVRYRREELLRRLSEDLGISGHVVFAGRIADAPFYMGDCDVICVPTIPLGIGGEGFGLVVAEAMAAGALVVSTNCGAPPEIIEDGVSGLLVPPWDPQALADAILRLLRDPGCREAMRQAAWRRVHEHFDVGRMAAAMQALYCEMARRGQGGVAGAGLP